MNQFIKPPYEKLEHGSCSYFTNNPVNLANVNAIGKTNFSTGSYSTGLPAIKFLGTETKQIPDGIIWIFPNNKERDNCFESIANNSFNVVDQLDPDRIRALQFLQPQDIYFKDNS